MLICNKIKIPKQFELGGRTILIKYKTDLTDNTNFVGEARCRINVIELQKEVPGVKRPVESIEETFLHELTHWILEMMEEKQLSSNEKFVSIFSQYFHQAFKTMTF